MKGAGSFVNENTIKVTPIDGGEAQEVEAENIIVATGSEPTPFPGIEIDEERIVTSTGILSLKEVPERLAIIGGGIIGLEMASVYSRLGSKVTVIEFQNAIGAGMDAEVAKQSQKLLAKQGLDFKLVLKSPRVKEMVKLSRLKLKMSNPVTNQNLKPMFC